MLLEALVEMIALLDAQADLRVELAELRVDLRQQRLVVLAAPADRCSNAARLPCHETSFFRMSSRSR